jgi:two-component system response regulator
VSETPVKVLVFSDNSSTRQAVITGVGFKASKDTAPIEWLEAATAFGVFELVDSHDIAVLVLDGETQKEGGMSVAKELANTRENLPPILMLTARPQDQWLATWAGASRIVSAPFDSQELQENLAELLRARR